MAERTSTLRKLVDDAKKKEAIAIIALAFPLIPSLAVPLLVTTISNH